MFLVLLIFMLPVVLSTQKMDKPSDGVLVSSQASQTNGNTVTLGIILPVTLSWNKTFYEEGSVYLFDLGYMKLIEDIVRDTLRKRNLLLDKKIVFVYKKSTCTNFAAFSAFEIQNVANVKTEEEFYRKSGIYIAKLQIIATAIYKLLLCVESITFANDYMT